MRFLSANDDCLERRTLADEFHHRVLQERGAADDDLLDPDVHRRFLKVPRDIPAGLGFEERNLFPPEWLGREVPRATEVAKRLEECLPRARGGFAFLVFGQRSDGEPDDFVRELGREGDGVAHRAGGRGWRLRVG